MKPKVDHSNTICCICRGDKSVLKYIDSEKNPVYLWYKEYTKNKKWTGRYMCSKCKWSLPWYIDLAEKSGYPYKIKNNIIGPFIDWATEKGMFRSWTEIQRDIHKKTIENAECKDQKEYLDKCAKNLGFINHHDYIDDLAKRNGFEDDTERRKICSWSNGESSPMEFSEECSYWLGAHIAERRIARIILPILFGGIEKEMPPSYPGYDFIVKGGYRVNVKSRRFIGGQWCFMVCNNNDTDYFLLIGFNNEYDEDKIVPIRIWLFHKNDWIKKNYDERFWKREGFTMTEDNSRLLEFKKYELTERFIKDGKLIDMVN